MIGKKLKELRSKQKISQADLAKAVHVGRSTVSMWEADSSDPDLNTVIAIADFFDISATQLLESGHETKTKRAAVRIPVYGCVPAGIPLEAIEDITDYEEIPADMLHGDDEYFGLVVHGDSMYPKYIDGDTVIVKKQDSCISGQDCVVYVNGYNATLKTVFLQPDGGVRLQPINTSYMPKTYYPAEDTIRIAGIVKELRRRI